MKHHAFTLIELLVVIAIIGLLSTIALVALNDVRIKARDTRRLVDMKQIMTALELYKDMHGYYPANTDPDLGCGNWDIGFYGGKGSGDTFIQPLQDDGIMNTPGDPLSTGTCWFGMYGYAYYRYAAGTNGCPASRGDYYVLGINKMEKSARPYPTSPGFSCIGRDWGLNYDWVTGDYTN